MVPVRRPPFETSTLPKLDLHGFLKPRAKKEAAQFLSDQNGWVVIVTGTGSHSSDGPVLRGAIEELLKRQNYRYSRNKGFFLVDAQSGTPQFMKASCEEDTKVVVRDSSDDVVAVQLARHRRRPRRMSSQEFPPEDIQLEEDPTLQEVIGADNDLKKAKEESLELQRLTWKQTTAEQRLLNQALSLSAHEDDKRKQEEDAMLLAALDASERYYDEEGKILETTLKESGPTNDSEINEAINLSTREGLPQRISETEEEEMVRQAIALSLRSVGDG